MSVPHPSLLLLSWLCAVVMVQKAPIPVIGVALAVAAILTGRAVAKAWLGLLHRSRWIVIVLVSTFALMTPGESIWPGLPVTIEGLVMALDHGMRLVTVLYAVAWLLAEQPTDRLVAALWGFATVARASFLERAVIRLALTLRQAGSVGPRKRDWRAMLGTAAEPVGADSVIQFEVRPMTAFDLMACATALVATATIWCFLP